MNPIENIKQIFTKNNVETPLLECFTVGELPISSGFLVACDPLITSGMFPFTTPFPIGNFPVKIHKEKKSNCVAYVEIVFSDRNIVDWEMALLPNQNPKDLKKDELFGYPVQSGMGCFMDFETQTALENLEKELQEKKGADFLGIYEEFFHAHFFDENGAIDQFAFLQPLDTFSGKIFAFEAGLGEGFYGSYIGLDDEKNPVKIITEFIEVRQKS